MCFSNPIIAKVDLEDLMLLSWPMWMSSGAMQSRIWCHETFIRSWNYMRCFKALCRTRFFFCATLFMQPSTLQWYRMCRCLVCQCSRRDFACGSLTEQMWQICFLLLCGLVVRS